MKKYLFILILLLGFILLTPGTLSATERSVNVSVDPRIELLAVVQFLSGYGDRYRFIPRHDFAYKRDVEEYFSPYKNHPAVKCSTGMGFWGFLGARPVVAMLYFSDPPNLKVQTPFRDEFKRGFPGERRLERFADLLSDFARDTEFMTFFENHKETYQQMVSDFSKNLEGVDVIGTLEDYYGIKQYSYNIILTPMMSLGGGYGHSVKQPDGTDALYCIFRSGYAKNGSPQFGDAKTIKDVTMHEFSHSFVYPLADEFSRQIRQYKSLYNRIIWDRMKEGSYYASWWPCRGLYWDTCVNEHIVRAVTSRLVCRENGKEAGEKAVQWEKAQGFFYVEDLYRCLEQYENQREKYLTFTDFFPEIVNVFKELSERKLGDDFYRVPFTGTINMAYAGNKQNLIRIVPTNETDKAVQKKIYAYVKKIRSRFHKGEPILTDKMALKRDLSHNSILAYGTLTGNLWVAQHLAELPVRIEPNQIVADTVYTGTHLRFITAWPNPQNPQNGIVVFTAQQPEDIIGIHSVLHGPTDYVVANGTEVLRAADYKKHNGQWTFK